MKYLFNRSWKLAFVVALGVIFASPVAANVNEGIRAYNQQQYVKAFRILEPHVKSENQRALLMFGLMYRNGRGVKKDLRKAYKYYKAAAVQGYARAQYNLAILILSTGKTDEKKLESIAWLKLASQQDLPRAQYHLGMFYWRGKYGLERDLILAHVWLDQSASQAFKKAVSNLEKLETEMTREQIEEARQYATQWRPKKFTGMQESKKPPETTGVQKPAIIEPQPAKKTEKIYSKNNNLCQSIDRALDQKIEEIAAASKELAQCVPKKDFYEDCKGKLVRLVVAYNLYNQILDNEWWECQD